MVDLRTELIETEIERQPEEVQIAYWSMVANGQTPAFAHMCALRQAPLTRYSDKTFNMEQRAKMASYGDHNMERVQKIARKAGINTHGKYYVGGLGRYNDPAAWVSTVDEVKAVCKTRNLSSEGLVKHQGSTVDPPKPKPVADDIVNRYIHSQVASEPALQSQLKRDPRTLQKLKNQAREKLSSRKIPPS